VAGEEPVAPALAKLALALAHLGPGLADLLRVLEQLDGVEVLVEAAPLVLRGQVGHDHLEAVDIDVVDDHHALLLQLVQVLDVHRVLLAFPRARRPQGDPLAGGRALVLVDLEAVCGDAHA